MYNNVHTEFILEPLYETLKKGINACSALTDGIENYPLGEYYMQSLFLRLTGAQEQKMKCICWELATNDYEYRQDYLRNKTYGECSSYTDKNGIFHDIIECIQRIDHSFSIWKIWNDIELDEKFIKGERLKWEMEINSKRDKEIERIIQARAKEGRPMDEEDQEKLRINKKSRPYPENDFYEHIAKEKRKKGIGNYLTEFTNLVKGSSFGLWAQKDVTNWVKLYTRILQCSDFANKKNETTNLLGGGLVKLYKSAVYDYRNKCAHNTTSYQRNLPTFDVLADNQYPKQSFFIRYSLLILMDWIFIRLYKYYLSVIKNVK